MATLKLGTNTINNAIGGKGSRGTEYSGDGYVSTPWTRPAEWITLTPLSESEHKVQGLYGVNNDETQTVSMIFNTTGAAQYRVNWGDGTETLHNSGSTATKTYNYSTITDVPGVSSTTLTKDGHRQVVITVTPVSGGFSAIDLGRQPGTLAAGSSVNWLDLNINSPTCTTLAIGSNTLLFYPYLERCKIGKIGDITNLTNLFYNCYRLEKIELDYNIVTTGLYYVSEVVSPTSFKLKRVRDDVDVNFTNNITSATIFKVGTLSNGYINTLVSSSVTGAASTDIITTSSNHNLSLNDKIFFSALSGGAGLSVRNIVLSRTFQNCFRLKEIPIIETAAVTSLSEFCTNCYSITSFPLWNTSSVSSWGNAFIGCFSLKEIPKFNTSSATSFAATFQNCYSLEYVPLLDTTNCTNMNAMFNGCRSLTTVPLFDTSNVTNMSSMFNNCSNLSNVPLFNTSNATNMRSMFAGCSKLVTVPLFDTKKVTGTGFMEMFSGCSSLVEVPLFDTSLASDTTSMFSACNELKKIPLFNTSSVTNFGYMFNGCHSLKEIPYFDTTNATNFNQTFFQCYNLIKIPLFDTSKVTIMRNMLNACYSLTEIPAFNCSLCTDFAFFLVSPRNISKINMTGVRFTLDISNARLTRAEIVNVFNNLGTASGTQTLTYSGNPGTASITAADKLIATSKGWTLVPA